MACIKRRRNRWVVDFRDQLGIRRWTTCRSREHADQVLAEVIKTTGARSRVTVDPDITLADYIKEKWLPFVAVTAKVRTVDLYRETAQQHVIPLLGTRKVRLLTSSVIRDGLVIKLNTFKPSTVGLILNVLQACLNLAVSDGLLPSNPTQGLRQQLKLSQIKRRVDAASKAMTRHELSRFLLSAQEHTPRYAPVFLCLARTGLRKGEAIGLTWDCLDLPRRQIHVVRQISRGRESPPKNGKPRVVDMSAQLAETFQRLRVQREADMTKRGWPEVPRFVFCTRDGRFLDESHISKAMTRALKMAHLPLRFSPHSLRHTFASILVSEGAPIQWMQQQLGHASIKLTVDLYGSGIRGRNLAAVDSLDAEHPVPVQ